MMEKISFSHKNDSAFIFRSNIIWNLFFFRGIKISTKIKMKDNISIKRKLENDKPKLMLIQIKLSYLCERMVGVAKNFAERIVVFFLKKKEKPVMLYDNSMNSPVTFRSLLTLF